MSKTLVELGLAVQQTHPGFTKKCPRCGKPCRIEECTDHEAVAWCTCCRYVRIVDTTEAGSILDALDEMGGGM